jgi:hypothetical protein
VVSSAQRRTDQLRTAKPEICFEVRLLLTFFLTVVLILTVANAPAMAVSGAEITLLSCSDSRSCASMVVGSTSFPGTSTTLLGVEPQYLLNTKSGQGRASGVPVLAANGLSVSGGDGGSIGQPMELIQWGAATPQALVGLNAYVATPTITLDVDGNSGGNDDDEDDRGKAPEPGSIILLLSGFVALRGFLRRRRSEPRDQIELS